MASLVQAATQFDPQRDPQPDAQFDQLCELRDEARLALLELQDDEARQGVQEVLQLIQSLMADTSPLSH